MEKETQMTMSEKKKKKIFIFIPNDILEEILSRLPVKSLLRFQWTCKYWFDLIRDPGFVKMHLQFHHSTATPTATGDYQNISLFLISKHPSHVLYSVNCRDIINNNNNTSSVQFDYCNLPVWIDHHTIRSTEEIYHRKNVQVGGSCNGLIFLYSYCSTCNHYSDIEYEYFLWNPSTREFKKLPFNEDPHRRTHQRLCFLGFGYDHTIDDYKVVDVVYNIWGDDDDVAYLEVNINIYTLGSNSWSIEINTYQLGDFTLDNLRVLNEGLFLNGALHWITKSAVISFDIAEEEHRQLQLPNYGDRGSGFFIYKAELQVLNGCLCVVNHFEVEKFRSETNLELWMMKDYGVNDSWTKLFTIDSRKSRNICGSWYLNDLKPIELCKDNGILMVFNNKDLVLYDLKNEKARWVHTVEDHRIDHIEHVYVRESYIESLVSLKSGMYLTAAGRKNKDQVVKEEE